MAKVKISRALVKNVQERVTTETFLNSPRFMRALFDAFVLENNMNDDSTVTISLDTIIPHENVGKDSYKPERDFDTFKFVVGSLTGIKTVSVRADAVGQFLHSSCLTKKENTRIGDADVDAEHNIFTASIAAAGLDADGEDDFDLLPMTIRGYKIKKSKDGKAEMYSLNRYTQYSEDYPNGWDDIFVEVQSRMGDDSDTELTFDDLEFEHWRHIGDISKEIRESGINTEEYMTYNDEEYLKKLEEFKKAEDADKKKSSKATQKALLSADEAVDDYINLRTIIYPNIDLAVDWSTSND